MKPIEYLSAYLAYDVDVKYQYLMFPGQWENNKAKLTTYLMSCFMNKVSHHKDYKLLLHPLSKSIDELKTIANNYIELFGTSPAIMVEKDYREWSVYEYREALKRHLDIFGLIKEGKAIEK